MSYTVLFSNDAAKDVKRLDTVVQRRLQKKLLEVAECKDITKIAKQLVNHDAGQYRLRVGDYRIIFDREASKTIFILRIRHRKEVYR